MGEEEFKNRRREVVALSIGYLAMEWARLEITIDGCVAHTHEFWGGKRYEPTWPRAMKRKLKFLRICFSNISVLSWAKPQIPLLERVLLASEERNWLIHGVLTNTEDGGKLTFTRSVYDAPKFEEKIISYDEIYELRCEISKIQKEASVLLETIMYVSEHYVYNPV